MLSGSERPEDMRDAMVLGAAGYLHKGVSPATIVTALRLVKAGCVVLERAAVQALAGARRVENPLTTIEQSLLKTAADGAGNTELAERFAVSDRTLKRHLQAIQDKLHVTNRMQAVYTASQRGLI